MSSNVTHLKRKPAKTDVLKLGAALMRANRFGEASSLYSKSLVSHPKDAHLYYCKGVALHKNNQILEAIHAYSQALFLNSSKVEAFENLSEAQTQLSMLDDALLSIRAAIALTPNKSMCHTRMARILVQLGKYEEAIDVATHALKLDHSNAHAHMVRSNAYRNLNRLEEGIRDLRKAINIDPSCPDYMYNLSFDLLLNQEFDEGWRYYESRFKTKNFLSNVPTMSTPRWNGVDNLDGKTILICPEQGIGDQIQFGRYALILKGLGAEVIFPVVPALMEIMQSMHPGIKVTNAMQPPSSQPKHDLHISLMSLPSIFKTDLDSIPCAGHYLTVEQSMSTKWAQRFQDKDKLQIGITWSGSQLHVNDHNRSMPLINLLPLFDLDADFHVLQTDIRPEDEFVLEQTSLKDWRNELTSLHETAGLLEQLDLLISVDTSVAHLSAALGKPTWVMLPFAPDFRWLLDRTDSPWYPSIQLFRQKQPRDWNSVISAVIQSLIGGQSK